MASFLLPKTNFNPRSPWGERQSPRYEFSDGRPISIHAPRGGSDLSECTSRSVSLHFNPRSPWGERRWTSKSSAEYGHFNPRSPWGERPAQSASNTSKMLFQSTLPVGGATITDSRGRCLFRISIHAPRGGSDACVAPCTMAVSPFQSTLPVGGATVQSKHTAMTA